ncbi:hypothetical protein FBUS_04878 [Fasciolopsis buskii]|uniref:Uncharacterized protein n=1 Tax=Fasciolopsis buskii TaxID=27845 RepID=A0A8E0S004_9TREM|nr:hypothetical protein FBUS_04878 [Fasciolopsis buski]
MFCFRTKKSPGIYDEEEEPATRPLYSACLRNPQPPVTVQLVETTSQVPSDWCNENTGDNAKSSENNTGKRVMTRAKLRELRAQSNYQLYKYSLPLVAEK